MRSKLTAWVCILLCVACLATGAAAVTYTWTGSGAWSTHSNWSYNGCFGPSCYPHTPNADAIFPTGGNDDCDLVDEEIDDLTINSDVDFGDLNGDDPVLYVDTVTISGATVATISEGAEITTTAAP